MNRLFTLGAVALCLSLGAVAHAAPGDNPQRRLDYLDNAGTLHEMDVSDAAKQAMFIAHAKKLAPGTLLMTLDGQIYILQDAKMENGQMMSDALMH